MLGGLASALVAIGEGMTSDGDVEDEGYDDAEEEKGREDDHEENL